MISLQELLEKKKRESYSENWLAEIHDLLMCEYGWIPFEEFKRLPIPLIISLVSTIIERRQKEEKELDKMKRPRLRR